MADKICEQPINGNSVCRAAPGFSRSANEYMPWGESFEETVSPVSETLQKEPLCEDYRGQARAPGFLLNPGNVEKLVMLDLHLAFWIVLLH